jgi:hypothetical protein
MRKAIAVAPLKHPVVLVSQVPIDPAEVEL